MKYNHQEQNRGKTIQSTEHMTKIEIRCGMNWGTEKSDGWGNAELRQLAFCGLGRPLSGEGGGDWGGREGRT